MAEERERVRLERVSVERIDLFAAPDFVFEDLLGLPSPGTLFRAIFPPPRKVLTVLKLPVPVEVLAEAERKVKERVAAAVR